MSSDHRASHYNSHRTTGGGFSRPSRDKDSQQQRHRHHHHHSSRSSHSSYSPRRIATDPAKPTATHSHPGQQQQPQANGPEVRLPFHPSRPPTTTSHRPSSAAAPAFIPPPPPQESAQQQPSKKISSRLDEKISSSSNHVKPSVSTRIPAPKTTTHPTSSISQPALEPKASQPPSGKRPSAAKPLQVQKKLKTGGVAVPTAVRIRPASFLVPSTGPNATAHPNPPALINYPKTLTVSQMVHRYAEDKKRLATNKQLCQAPAVPEVLCIDDDVSSKQPPSSRSSGSSSRSSSSCSSRPQSVRSLFDDIEAMPNESPVVLEEPTKPSDEDEDQPDSEPEFNQVRVNRWQPKHYDSTIFSVSHCQGKANEQLQLLLLEDNEDIVSLVNKGRHSMSVRPGPVKTGTGAQEELEYEGASNIPTKRSTTKRLASPPNPVDTGKRHKAVVAHPKQPVTKKRPVSPSKAVDTEKRHKGIGGQSEGTCHQEALRVYKQGCGYRK